MKIENIKIILGENGKIAGITATDLCFGTFENKKIEIVETED